MRVETIGNATLYLGDCREVLPMLGGLGDGCQNPDVSVEQGRGAGNDLKTRIFDLIENARAFAEGETPYIARENMIALCDVYGREWIGGFSRPAQRDYTGERIMALCMASAILRRAPAIP